MKNAIIARIKAGETIPLKPDIEKLYYLNTGRPPGGCSYRGAGESCWTSKFQELYDELKKEAGLETSTVAEEPATVKMAVTPNTSVGSSCASRHFNREEDREECYRRQKAGKKKTRKISRNHRKRKTSRRRR